RVLDVEHPAVGAAEQRVGHIAKSDLDRRSRARGGASALDPLPFQIAGNLGTDEIALARILDRDRSASDDAVRIEKADALPLARATGPPVRGRRAQRFDT